MFYFIQPMELAGLMVANLSLFNGLLHKVAFPFIIC